jgi:hypothetical protein
MAFTYQPTTSRGRVRLLIPDRVTPGHIFEDAEIDTFLVLETNNVKRSTALGLETIASDQALTLKVIRLLDLTTDGARVSDALLKRAAELRRQADIEELAEDGGAFDIAEWTPTDFAYRERLENEMLRGAP